MMNIDDLTIGQAKQLAAMFAAQVASESAPELDAHLIGTPVIIRTYSAGVHFGIHDGRKGPEIRLKDARRIWYWNKAFTLSKIAVDGLGEDSKLSVAVPEIVLTECIEVIPCSKTAANQLSTKPAHQV
jgi:hypothetical protein